MVGVRPVEPRLEASSVSAWFSRMGVVVDRAVSQLQKQHRDIKTDDVKTNFMTQWNFGRGRLHYSK